MPTGPQSERLAYLDGLRGLAALSVVWSHFFIAYGWPAAISSAVTLTPLHIFWDGAAAVTLFFVLSGLSQSLKHFQPSPSPAPQTLSLGAFYISRYMRIAVPFWVVIGLSAIVRQHLFCQPLTDPVPRDWLLGYWVEPLDLRDVASRIVMVGSVRYHGLVPQAWALYVILNMSLLMPLLILAAKRGVAWLCAFGLVATIILRSQPLIVCAPALFCLGVALAKHYRQILGLASRLSRGHKVGLLGLALLLYTARYGAAAAVGSSDLIRVITGLGAALLIVACICSARLRAALTKPWLSFLGRISFSLYLVHMIVLIAITPPCIEVLNRIGVAGNAARLAGFAMTTLFSLALAAIFYYAVEAPVARSAKRTAIAYIAASAQRPVPALPLRGYLGSLLASTAVGVLVVAQLLAVPTP